MTDDGRPCVILLVCADEGRRLQVTRLLARSGYRPRLATSPREAIHMLAAGGTTPLHEPVPNVILVDQEGLGRAAITLITAVRNAELGVPTVILSGFGASDDVIACLRAGAADYISMPADPQQILDVLRRVLNSPRVV